MSSVATAQLIEVLLDHLEEAYEGPMHPRTWFIGEAGVMRSLAGLSATEASRPVAPGATTIAAHAEHLRWSLNLANAIIASGVPPQVDWQESWTVHEVDEEGWEQLKANLRNEYQALRQNIASQTDLSPQMLPGVMCLVPHAAYHLGAIRQMIKVVTTHSPSA